MNSCRHGCATFYSVHGKCSSQSPRTPVRSENKDFIQNWKLLTDSTWAVFLPHLLSFDMQKCLKYFFCNYKWTNLTVLIFNVRTTSWFIS